MSLSILQVQSFASTCAGGFTNSCWLQCQEFLQFYLTSGSGSGSQATASFGPRDAKVSNGTETCPCESYMIFNAEITQGIDQSPQAMGSSPGNVPFASVIVQRASNDGVSVSWVGGGTAPFGADDTCAAFYVPVSGPTVLYYQGGFHSWWTAFVGCILGIFLLCGFCAFCKRIGKASRTGKQRTEWHNAISRSPRRPQPNPIVITEMRSNPSRSNTGNASQEWNGQRSSMMGSNIVNPQTSFGEERMGSTSGSGNIPLAVAIAIPVDDNGRQLAIV